MKDLSRKLVNRMVDKTGSSGGGGNSYVPQSKAVSWTDIDGKPTTLAGYGITDVKWATEQSTSDKRNLTIGSVTQQVITAHQSLSGYATEYWVGQQGYLTSVSWGDVSGKPETYPPSAHSHSWSSITGKPASKTAWGKTFWDANGDPQSISGDMSGVGNIAFAASGKNIGGLLYFDTANGRLGIGTSSPRAALDISGGLVTTGDQTISSDIRMKKVIDFYLPINVDEIAAAPVIHFTLKNDKNQARRIGSVAQYWKKFMPEAVPTGDDGMLSMGYGSIALVSAVALAREVVTLKQEVSKLQKLIRNQEKNEQQ